MIWSHARSSSAVFWEAEGISGNDLLISQYQYWVPISSAPLQFKYSSWAIRFWSWLAPPWSSSRSRSMDRKIGGRAGAGRCGPVDIDHRAGVSACHRDKDQTFPNFQPRPALEAANQRMSSLDLGKCTQQNPGWKNLKVYLKICLLHIVYKGIRDLWSGVLFT